MPWKSGENKSSQKGLDKAYYPWSIRRWQETHPSEMAWLLISHSSSDEQVRIIQKSNLVNGSQYNPWNNRAEDSQRMPSSRYVPNVASFPVINFIWSIANRALSQIWETLFWLSHHNGAGLKSYLGKIRSHWHLPHWIQSIFFRMWSRTARYAVP